MVDLNLQDSQDPNPLIRALAVRTMGCIRVDKITEYLCDPLQRCLKVRPHRYSHPRHPSHKELHSQALRALLFETAMLSPGSAAATMMVTA